MTDGKSESANKFLASGVSPRDVANNLGVSVPTLYRWIPCVRPALTCFIIRFLKGPQLYLFV